MNESRLPSRRDRSRDDHRLTESAAEKGAAAYLAGIAQEPDEATLRGGRRSRPAKPKKPETDTERKSRKKKERRSGERHVRRVLKRPPGTRTC